MNNRFDTSVPQQYISQYIPLPFQQIGALGEKITHEHKKKQAEVDALTDMIDKINVSNEVLSEGTVGDLGIKSRSTGYGEFKNEVANKYSQINKQLTDDYYSGKLDKNQFAQKVNQLKYDFSQDYQKLKIAESNSIGIEEANKKYKEKADAGIQGNQYILNPLAEEGRRLLDNPFGVQYKGAPIGDALKIEDEVNKSAMHYADQIGQTGTTTDKFGNVIYSKTHGVTVDRIKTEVLNTYDDGVGKHTQQQVMRSLLDEGINPNTPRTVKVPTSFDKTGKPTEYKDVQTTEFNLRYNKAKQDYAEAVIAKAEKSVLDQSIHKNWQLSKQMDWGHEEKIAQDALNFVGNSVPGSTVDVLSKDPSFKSLSKEGVLNVDNNGIVTIDWSKMGDKNQVSGYTTNSMIPGSSAVTTTGKTLTTQEIQAKRNELDSFVTKAARAIGYSDNYIADLKKGNIKGQTFSNNMEKIVTAYNILSKSKLGGVQLPSDVQEIESSRVMASPESYTIYDPIKHNTNGVTVNKGDKVNVGERVYVDGKAFSKATIQRVTKPGGDPITETVLLKPQSKNSSDYFDRGIGTTQNAIMDLFVSGGEPNKKYIENYDPKKDSKVVGNFDDDNNPLTPPVKMSLSTFARGTLSNEGGQKVSYTFIKDDNQLGKQVYILHTPEGNLSFNDYNEYLVHADAAYYLYGRGKSDATSLKNKFKYDRLMKSKLSSQDNSESE